MTTANNDLNLIQAQAGINAAFDLIGLTQLRNDPRFEGIDGSGFSVAVIDTGLDRNHPSLAPNYITGVDFVRGGDNPIDDIGHGTHVAGTVGARDENIGVAPDAGLIGLQVFQPTGGAYNSTLEDALEWVYDNRNEHNIVAVNLSLGGGFYDSPNDVNGDILVDDIERLEGVGITVVAAGGNSFKDNEYGNFGAPAIYSTLAVGAVWQDGVNNNAQWGSGAIDFTTGADRVTSFSQRLDASNTIFAPGALINSTVPGGGFDFKGGTSMASPIVAGAVALMQEAAQQFGGRLLSPDEIVEIMRSTAVTIFDGDDEDDNVNNTNVSYPRLNIYAAVEEIQNRFREIAPPPPEGGAGDANGTIAGAIIGPSLDGSPVNGITGSIGVDGNSTQIGATDVDFYRFELLSPGNVTIALGSDAANPADFDSFLRLFDANGNELINADGGGQGDFSSLSTNLAVGTYFVGVSGDENRTYDPNTAGSGIDGATGNYELQFSLGNDDPNGLISGAVEVNLGNDREPLLFEGFIGADYGEAVGVADVDLFKVVVPDNGILFVDIDTPFNTDFVDSYLRIFEADGSQAFFEDTGEIIVSDDDLSFDAAGNFSEFTDFSFPDLVFEDPFDRTFFHGHITDSFIAGTVERGDVYYIGVSDFFNQDYDATNLNDRPAIGGGGLYNLIVTFVNPDINGSIDQAIADAPLPLVNQQGFIGSDGDPVSGELLTVGNRDVDFIKINSPQVGILEIDIDSYTASSIFDPVDTVVSIFDADGNILANDDDTDSFDPLVQFQIEADTDYYVAVTGYGNDNFDPFALGSGSGGDIGEYIFNSRVLPLSQTTILSDNTINDDAIQSIELGGVIFGDIGEDNGFVTGAEDIDIYRFTPDRTGKIEIRTTTTEEFSADTFLRFFDARGTEIAANDNANANTRSSLIEVEVTAGTEYFIGVNGASERARAYDPITGDNAAPTERQGTYALAVTLIDETPIEPRGGTSFGTGGDDEIVLPTEVGLLFAGGGGDTIDAQTNNATQLARVYAGNGDDRLIAGTKDRLFGGKGEDTIDGTGAGTDNRFYGGDNADTFYLGNGDLAVGGGGNDRFFVGAGGDNLLVGGAGADEFAIVNAELPEATQTAAGIPSSVNRIFDFTDGVDILSINGLAALEIADTDIKISAAGENAIVSVAGTDVAEILGIAPELLSISPPDADSIVIA